MKLMNRTVKNLISAVALAGLGLILLNLAFMLDFLFQSSLMAGIRLFAPEFRLDAETMSLHWFPPIMHIMFVGLIGLISWAILHSRLKDFFKATFLVVPVAVVLVTLGMFLNRWPWAAFLLGGVFSAGVIYYLYRTKRPWLYFYSVILISITLAVFTLTGGEI